MRRLNNIIVAAVAKPEVRKLIEDKMAEPRSSSPEELASIIQREITHWKPVITRNNIKL